VLLDIWLDRNDLDGLQILQKIKKDRPEQPVIMISGHGNVETAVNATKYGAYDFIEKPFEPDRMIVTIKRALENIQLKEQIDNLKTRISNENLNWADYILVMERSHRNKIREEFQDVYNNKRILCMYIEDNYDYMDSFLIELLKGKFEFYGGRR